MDLIQPYVREYLEEKQNEGEPFPERREFALDFNIPIIREDTRDFLKVLLKTKEPKEILEVGTAIGYSTLILAKYAPQANITTLELDESLLQYAIRDFEKRELRQIEALAGDANQLIPDLDKTFDFIFLDAAKGQYPEMFEKCLVKLAHGGVLVADNVLFHGLFGQESADRRRSTIIKRMDEFLDQVLKREDVTATVLPIGDGVCWVVKE